MADSILPHPGTLIRTRCLGPCGLTVAEGARLLGVTRQALNNVVNGKAGISPEMAIRLSKVFGEDDETWLQLQLAYELAQTRKRADIIMGQCAPLLPRSKKELRPLCPWVNPHF